MIEVIGATGSTNADLAARLKAGGRVGEGFWLVADRQSAGRGRLGRVWDDAGGGAGADTCAGNFMGSTVVTLHAYQPHAGSLALVAGLAVQAAVADYVPPPLVAMLKWPNDVMIGGAKLAGILLEMVGDQVVVGIGVNLARAPAIVGRDTVALSRFGPAPDRDSFAARLAVALDQELARWRDFGLDALIGRWQAVAHPVGAALAVSQPDGSLIKGTFAGLNATGALRLIMADGTCATIHAGDVSLG